MKCKYNISNLDCANCARKIEEALKKDKNILDASVNFSTLKLTCTIKEVKDPLKYISKIVNKVEPDVTLYENTVKEENITSDIIRLVIGIVLGILGLLINNTIISNILLILGYIILLSKTFLRALNLLIKNKTINENFLITISCIGAYFINKQSEGLMVIILYEIGKILEAKAINNSRKSIAELMNLAPEFANKLENNNIKKVKPNEVKVGDIIVVKEGEKVPLDGIVIKGSAKFNTASLTGESALREIDEKENVLSGMINTEGLVEVKVTVPFEDSTVNKILELVENATEKKAKTETFVTKASKIYTPLVVILAILVIVFGLILTNYSFSNLFYKALIFLVISCPCSIAISVPLSYFAAIGYSSKRGILIKGSNYLDNLNSIDKIIFDKTGTLTTGTFNTINIEILDKNYTIDEVKQIIAKGESLSNHPIAKSLVDYINIDVKNNDVKEFKELKGKGITFKINKDKIMIGNYKLCNETLSDSLYLKVNNKLVAKMDIIDDLKDEAPEIISELQKQGIKCEIFTGDNKAKAMKISKKLNVDNVLYELLPQDKYDTLNNYLQDGENIAFVGDGVNDAPVLALATTGISMGGIGSSSAIEASDVVLMDDNLLKILEAIKISKKTNKIIKENLIFSIFSKILVLTLTIFGIASMWQAVFADVGVTLVTILNSMRITKNKLK